MPQQARDKSIKISEYLAACWRMNGLHVALRGTIQSGQKVEQLALDQAGSGCLRSVQRVEQLALTASKHLGCGEAHTKLAAILVSAKASVVEAGNLSRQLIVLSATDKMTQLKGIMADSKPYQTFLQKIVDSTDINAIQVFFAETTFSNVDVMQWLGGATEIEVLGVACEGKRNEYSLPVDDDFCKRVAGVVADARVAYCNHTILTNLIDHPVVDQAQKVGLRKIMKVVQAEMRTWQILPASLQCSAIADRYKWSLGNAM